MTCCTQQGLPTQQNESTQTARTNDQAALLPPVDVFEDSTGITLYADLPGVAKDKLDIQIDADQLNIEGEIGLFADSQVEASHAEVSLPRYRRSFSLSKELDTDKIQADFSQGVLTLRIPKLAQAQPKKISINVH